MCCTVLVIEYVQQESKRKGGAASSIKLNLYLTPAVQYHASTTVEGCQAGGLGHLLHYLREYNAQSPKQDSKRFYSHGRRNNLPIWVNYLSMDAPLYFSINSDGVSSETLGFQVNSCFRGFRGEQSL